MQNDSRLMSDEKIIVEEQKFTQSQEESSSQSNNDHLMNIGNNSAQHITPHNFYEHDMI